MLGEEAFAALPGASAAGADAGRPAAGAVTAPGTVAAGSEAGAAEMRDIVKSVLPATGASGSTAADLWQESDPWTMGPTTAQPDK
eukprot:4851062-Pyramimonas_sp.AAC.1